MNSGRLSNRYNRSLSSSQSRNSSNSPRKKYMDEGSTTKFRKGIQLDMSINVKERNTKTREKH